MRVIKNVLKIVESNDKYKDPYWLYLRICNVKKYFLLNEESLSFITTALIFSEEKTLDFQGELERKNC